MLTKLINVSAATALLAFSVSSFAADIDANADANDLAIKGYDTVAYFTKGQPTKGSQQYTATYKNAIYQFSSANNRDLFQANPAKYAPQFGGYCAFGVTKGRKFDTDPTAWRVVDGKLYLNLNHDVQKIWSQDVPGYITTAVETWPNIKSFSDNALEQF